MNKLLSMIILSVAVVAGCAATRCRKETMKNLQQEADGTTVSKLGIVKFQVTDCTKMEGVKGYVCSIKVIKPDGTTDTLLGEVPIPDGCK